VNRTHTVTNHLGEIISSVQRDVTWPEVKKERRMWFNITDLWYLKDRWDGLSTVKKGQLNSFRQGMRDLPQAYDTANDAADNFPETEDWYQTEVTQ